MKKLTLDAADLPVEVRQNSISDQSENSQEPWPRNPANNRLRFAVSRESAIGP
jgi:hypothetical protein